MVGAGVVAEGSLAERGVTPPRYYRKSGPLLLSKRRQGFMVLSARYRVMACNETRYENPF